MAKSRKRKRIKQTPQTFYEAIPMAVTPPVIMSGERPGLETAGLELNALGHYLVKQLNALRYRSWNWDGLWLHIRIAAPIQAKRLWQISRQVGRRSLHWLKIAVQRAGIATTDGLIVVSRTAFAGGRHAARSIWEYSPAALGDMAAALRRLTRSLMGRRAKLMYILLSLGAIAVGVTTAAVIANATLKSYANDISSPAALLSKKKTGTTILDRNGKVLFEGYGAQASQDIKLADMPQALKDATLAAEDPEFYSHPGFSWQGTARAAWVDVSHGARAEGGSTLTQQLVKNALLTSDKNFQRKYQELLLSMELEKHYSKDQILEMYLNEIYYGQGSSGVEAASKTYFHKSARDLTLGEAALIAGLPLGPSRLDPNVDLNAATGRRDFVLSRMTELGKITKSQADAAKASPLRLASAAGTPNADNPSGTAPTLVYAKQVNIQAPHFVFYVLNQLRSLYGDDIIEQGGITVRTTLDLDKQNLAQQIVADRVGALAEHNVTNGGLISLKPETGEILAMVGSRDYNAPGFGNVNVTLSPLQPGSSFKPIAYATAFKKGWNGATTIDDTPLSVPNGDGTMYTPMNYDLKFHGQVTLRHALDNSLNIPAVKVLQYAGIHDTIQTAHDMGATGLQDESRYGLSLVLGGGEVRPIDMATVYATLANGGIKAQPKAILSVSDRQGKDITKPSSTKPEQVLDNRIAYMITNILSDDSARQPEFPANGPLHLSRPAAAKTGTTNDFRDNWTVGYTPSLATAVWVGNNDHSPMNNVDGITGAAPIWHDYMEGALAGTPVENFTAPGGVTTARVCAKDGGLANPWDQSYDEVFMSDNVPTRKCNSSQPDGDHHDDDQSRGGSSDDHGPIGSVPSGGTPPIIMRPPRFFDSDL